jgi:hypothetical protein
VRKIAIASLVAILLCIQLPMTAVPDWSVTVVDGSGLPVEGITVRESYQDYSIEAQGHERDQLTDVSGKAHFAHITVWHSLGRRAVGTILSALTGGVHASFGTHASVFAFGKGEGSAIRNGYVEDWTGSPGVFASKIVVH